VYKNLRDYIETLERLGELRRVRTEVDPVLEISEIASRVVKSGGPALLFERVKGSAYPLAINLFGTEQRMALALGANSLDAKAAEIQSLISLAMGFLKDFNPFTVMPGALPKVPEIIGAIPRRVKHAACQEVI
jgi:4-hydroxy-3-polyprenylbenzoate decarboxylase